MIKINSCFNCNERTVGCHSVCEKYIQNKIKYDEQKEIIRTIKINEKNANSVAIDNLYKRKKRRNSFY